MKSDGNEGFEVNSDDKKWRTCSSKQSAGRNEFNLFRRPKSPYLHVRFMVGGKRRQFSTGETSERAARNKARAILADIRSRGLQEAVSLHAKKSASIGSNPTIEEFVSRYQKLATTFDSPPSSKSLRVYGNSLKLIASYAGVSRLLELNTEALEKAKRAYLLRAAESGRDPNSSRVSLGSVLRNAASLYSSESLAAFRNDGLELANPFGTVKVRGVKLKSYSPLPRDLLSRIWAEAALLRDGNPDSPPPDPTIPSKRRIDFRQPHPDAFAILFLELGLGLRRNEADKAEWSWCMQSSDGRRYLEVRQSDCFVPKSKQSRIIPMADEVWEALLTVETTGERFIVPETKVRRHRTGMREYRSDAGHRALVEWLKVLGVTAPKPCHALRKEFGSYVATSFSLFHAQKLLGHSTPQITSAYYAGLTDLPLLRPSLMGSGKSEPNRTTDPSSP